MAPLRLASLAVALLLGSANASMAQIHVSLIYINVPLRGASHRNAWGNVTVDLLTRLGVKVGYPVSAVAGIPLTAATLSGYYRDH